MSETTELKDYDLYTEVSKYLEYNPETGEIIWKSLKNVRGKVKSLAGTKMRDGRRVVGFNRKRYMSYRLSWLLFYGVLPTGVIDHIDGNPLNDKIENLRDVSRSVNQQNQRKAHSTNKSNLLGAAWHSWSEKYQSTIHVNGKQRHLGTFDTAEEAHAAYLKAKRDLHEGNTL